MRTALGLTAALLVLAACGGPAPAGDPEERPAPAPPEAPSGTAAPDPAALYKSWGCSICHGVDRRGGKNAPSLAKLGSDWTVDTLADYILEPGRWRESDPRVRKLAERYPKLTMPPSRHPESERRALAAWLLSGEGSR